MNDKEKLDKAYKKTEILQRRVLGLEKALQRMEHFMRSDVKRSYVTCDDKQSRQLEYKQFADKTYLNDII